MIQKANRNLMEPIRIEDKIKIASETISQLGSLSEEVEPDEIITVAEDLGEKDYKKIAKTIVYIRKRFIEGMSRQDAFKIAFPERCVVQVREPAGGFSASHKEVGSPLDESTLKIKAKRLENTKLYKYIVTMLNTSLHTVYALERIKVLDFTLQKIFDDDTKDRERVEYIKTFLQETRKPEKAQEFEVNVNIQNNEVNVTNIENRLSDFANKLARADAGSIIDMIQGKK